MASSGNQGGNSSQGSGKQGFASMDPERQREIAAEGGRASHSGGGGNGGGNSGGGSQSTRGGTSEQHAEAGRQSHKNSN